MRMHSFGRHIDYLRISVTDRCNERCLYCRPRQYAGWNGSTDLLSDEELLRIVRVAAELGFRKFRLTGGEPLLRPGLVELVRAMSAIPGVECIGISTNGLKLPFLAGPLRAAGAHTVNISLDALSSAGDEPLRRVFEQAIANKPWEHALRDDFTPCRPMTAIGG